MKYQMRNRILSFFLALAMLCTSVPFPVNSVENESIAGENGFTPVAGNYGTLIGAAAELNFAQWNTIVVSDDPTIAMEDGQDLYATDAYDMKLVVEGVHWVEETCALWLKVAAAEGYTLTTKLQENPWVFQNFTDVYADADWEDYSPDALLLTIPDGGQVDMATGVTVTGELPEGAKLDVQLPEVDGEALPGVYDIKIYLEDGTEWQPIDDGVTVTVSIPVPDAQDGAYADVYHFIDYAADINGDEEVISTEDATAEELAILQPALDAYGDGVHVAVEVTENVLVNGGVASVTTDSFSLYQYDGSQYIEVEDGETVDGRLVVTFNSSYSSSDDSPAYSEVTQYFYASPEQLFRLRTSEDNVWQDYKDPYSIIEKPSDATDEESTSTQVLNNPDTYLENLDEQGSSLVDMWRTRHAHLNIVGLLPGDVIWLQCVTRSQTTYMKITVVDEVNITFDKNLDSATLENTSYGPIATDGDEEKNLFTIPTAAEYIPQPEEGSGHVFKGWNTSASGDGTSYLYDADTNTFTPSAFTPMRNMTLYAMWDAPEYVVKFDSNGGQESYADVTVDSESTITLPDAPTRTDYIFIGWSASTDGYSTIYPAGGEFTVHQDVTMYALWAVTLTITVYGGTLSLQLEDEFSATPLEDRYYETSGNKMFEVSEENGITTYTAYPIEGFFKNARFTFTYTTDTDKKVTTNSIGTTVTFTDTTGYVYATIQSDGMDQNTTISFAATDKTYYIVSYDTNFGSAVSSDMIESGKTLEAFPTTTRTGYAFAGWYLDAALTQAASLPLTVTENITLYAKWTANTYTVNFVDHDGTTLGTQTVEYGNDATAPAAPEREGYTFAGWNTQADGKGTSYAAGAVITITGDVTLYAQWTVNTYTVTWVVDGVSTTETYEYGATPIFKGSTDKAADAQYTYTFTGWTPTVSTVTGDVTYTATYSGNVNTYTVIWKNWDGTVLETDENVPYGTLPTYDGATPTKAATAQYTYTFAGWTPAVSEITGDTEYTAVFAQKDRYYKVSFVSALDITDPSATVDQSLPYNTEIQLPTLEPVDTGFAFEGWDSDGDGKVDFAGDATFTVTADTVLRAVWAPKPFVITYEFDGVADVFKPDMENGGNYQDEVTVLTPEIDGYTFVEIVSVVGAVTGKEYDLDSDNALAMPAEDLVVTLNYALIQYKIEYDLQDGKFRASETPHDSFTREDSITLLQPYKPGYTFEGWIVNEGDTPDKYVTISQATGDRKYTAVWSLRTYTITLRSDGNVLDTISYNIETSPFTLTQYKPTKTGHTFVKWVIADEAGSEATWYSGEIGADFEVNAMFGNVILDAVWEIDQFTITFKDGNTTLYEITQDYGTDVTAPADPTKEGYTFAGWDIAIPATMPAGNMTITAQWTVNQYTITFDTAGGSAIAAITQDYGTAITAPADPTKTGYTFAGWDVEIPATMPAENITITAQWTANKHTVSYSSTLPITGEDYAEKEYAYGETVTVTSAVPTYADYTFLGWKCNIVGCPECSGEGLHKAGDTFIMPDADVTLTAQWDPKPYTLTYIIDGSTQTQAFYPAGTDVTIADAPTREGHTFGGWKCDMEDCTDCPDGNYHEAGATFNMPAADVTLTAQWTVIQYTITFKDYDGTVLSTQSVDYGSQPVMSDPKREMTVWHTYTFNGWEDKNGDVYTSADLPAVTGDMTYTAVYTENDCKVFIGLNLSYHIVGGTYRYKDDNGWWQTVSAYHTLPPEPYTLDNYEGRRVWYDSDNRVWRVAKTWTQEQGVYNNSIGNAESFIPEAILNDAAWVTHNSARGIYDATGALVEKYFTFLDADVRNAILTAWLQMGEVNNTDIFWNKVSPEDCEIIPYVIKQQESGDWYIDLVVIVETAPLVISVPDIEDSDGQMFLFEITASNHPGFRMVVAVPEGESVTVKGLFVGKEYVIRELTDWSWRCGASPQWVYTTDEKQDVSGTDISLQASGEGDTATFILGTTGNQVSFTNTLEDPGWLGGESFREISFSEGII